MSDSKFESYVNAIMLDLLDDTILNYKFPLGSLDANKTLIVQKIADQHGIDYNRKKLILERKKTSF